MNRSWAFLFALATACAAPSPTDDSAQPQLALSYTPDDSDTGRSIRTAQAKVRHQPRGTDARIDLARLLMRRRRETSAPILMRYARDAIDAALRISPTDPHARWLLGLSLQYEHRFEQAAATARGLIAQRPQHPGPYHLLGDALLELGTYDEAIEAYQAAMDLRPDLRAYNRAAYITWLHGGFDEAVRLLDMALDAGSRRDPEASAWCFVDLGEIYRHRGDHGAAIAAAERALKLVPQYVPALTLRARARGSAGQNDESLADYRTVLKRLPTVETLLESSELLERMGDRTQAKRRFQQAWALAESDPRPMAHYLARHNRRPKDALRLARAELEARKGIFAQATLALVLIRHGALDEAEAALNRAEARQSPFAEFKLHRALLAVAKGEPRAAQSALNAALKLNATVDPVVVQQIKRALSAPSKG